MRLTNEMDPCAMCVGQTAEACTDIRIQTAELISEAVYDAIDRRAMHGCSESAVFEVEGAVIRSAYSVLASTLVGNKCQYTKQQMWMLGANDVSAEIDY